MEFGVNASHEVVVFDGTRKDVFDAIGSLVEQKGFVVYSSDLVIREKEDIQSRHDIHQGDFILFNMPAYEESFVIGFAVGNPKILERIVYAVGTLEELENDVHVAVSKYDLGNDMNREMYEKLLTDFDEQFQAVLDNFRDVLLIEGSKEDIYNVISSYKKQPNEPIIDMYDISSGNEERVEVSTIEDISPGVVLIGEAQREDESPQIAMLAYDVSDDDLLVFMESVYDTMGSLNFSEEPPKIIRESFAESRFRFMK